MISIIRKNQQALMIVITILVIISFIAFFNGPGKTNRGASTPDKVATIYNRGVTLTEFERTARKFYVARQLGLAELSQLLGLGNNQNEQVQAFIINLMVLQHEADQLQIVPTAAEIQAEEKKIFQTDGEFDAKKLSAFSDQVLSPLGFTSAVIDDLVTDSLRLRKLKELVGSAVAVSPAELRNAANLRYQKTEITVIRFSLPEALAGIQVSDEDVQKTYEQRKEGLKSDESRKIHYVTFALSDADNALKDSSRIDALQKLANKANDFIQAASAKDAKFEEVAAQFKVPVTETGEFTQLDPDSKIEKLQGVAAAAFKLTQEKPIEAVQDGTTFYILHLENVTPSRPLSQGEAKPKIVEQLKNERAREAISSKAGAARIAIEISLKVGKSLADAATPLSLKVEKIPAFSLDEFPQSSSPDLKQIVSKSVEMSEGQLSEFIPTQDGGSIIFVEKRSPLDDAKFAEVNTKLSVEILNQKQAFAFLEWLRIRRDAAKIQFAQR
ncbi:MAG: SurA N-terminal domain-containing protein [Verrucomicrobiota bacterium]